MRDSDYITPQNTELFCNTNESLLQQPVRAIVLEFPGLADGQLPPVSGPWVLLNTLRSGYITSCAQGEGYLQITLEDRFRDEDLTMDIWLDGENCPIRGEIGWDGRRVLTMEITDFVIS